MGSSTLCFERPRDDDDVDDDVGVPLERVVSEQTSIRVSRPRSQTDGRTDGRADEQTDARARALSIDLETILIEINSCFIWPLSQESAESLRAEFRAPRNGRRVASETTSNASARARAFK